jgi:hypothetical protein
MTRIEKKKKIISKERIKDRRPFFRVVVVQIPANPVGRVTTRPTRDRFEPPRPSSNNRSWALWFVSPHISSRRRRRTFDFSFLFTFRVGSAVAYIPDGDTWRHTDVVRGRKWATTKQNKKIKSFLCVCKSSSRIRRDWYSRRLWNSAGGGVGRHLPAAADCGNVNERPLDFFSLFIFSGRCWWPFFLFMRVDVTRTGS